MDAFGARELRDLTGEQEVPCLSIYLTTHVAGEQGQQDRVRLKNLVQQAEQELSDRWMRSAEAREFVQPARDLPANPVFWNDRNQGLAIFVSPKSLRSFRLSRQFDERVIVNRRFYIKPLLPLLTADSRFLVLSLSQNKVQFFVASRDSIERVEVPGLPETMSAALNYSDADRGSQVHSAMRGSLGKQAAVFHGHGGKPDTRKDDLAQYFRLIDAALAPILRDETAPLLLAGVEYLLPIYREVNRYAHLAPQELVGNWDYQTAHEIHLQAWTLMEPTLQQEREEAAAKYTKLAGTERTTDDVRQIVSAAHAGRVESLFVDASALQWGRYDPQTTAVELHDQPQPGDDDLLDLAAVQTTLCRGAVYSIERGHVPSGTSAAAVLRY